MRILVLGGSGRTGRHLLAALKAAGHEARAYGRRAPDGWAGDSRIGALDDARALGAALAGADAAISCLATTGAQPVCLAATQTLARVAAPGFRYLVVGGAAVDAPGDAKGAMDKVAGALMRLTQGKMLAERQAELGALMASNLAWTFVRPPMLGDKAGTGRWRFTFDKPANFRIERADLARALIEGLGRADLARRAPFVAGVRG